MAGAVSQKKVSFAPFFVSLVVTLVFCGLVLHRFLFFRLIDSPVLVVLFFVLWLCFRIAYPRLADPLRVGQGFLVGLELFLLAELAANTYFLHALDPDSFATSFYLSGGILLLLDRVRMMFPSVKARWPLPLFSYGMAALLFFGSVSSVLLMESTCRKLVPDECRPRRSQAVPTDHQPPAPAADSAPLHIRGPAGAQDGS